MGDLLRRQTGGRSGLNALLREHWREIEADFRSEYSLSLREAVYGKACTSEGRLSAGEILNLIHQLPTGSRLVRKLRGPMAEWGTQEFLLRNIEFHLAGANWQRGGGKKLTRPKLIPLPDGKGRGGQPSSTRVGGDLEKRLRSAGLIPPGSSD